MTTLEQINQLRNEYVEKTQGLILDAAKSLIHKYSRVNSISVIAYTPYWSDGDPCTFSVHSYDPYINGVDNAYEDEVEGENLYRSKDEEAQTIIREVREFFRGIPDRFFNEVFGDHFKLTITAEGFKVEEYDHE